MFLLLFDTIVTYLGREVTLFISFDQIFNQELSKKSRFTCFLSTQHAIFAIV
jgi:hypothetical protein